MDPEHLSIEEVRERLCTDNPKLVFVMGKTCTGKSTFAKSLAKQRYKHLELDFTVINDVVKKFEVSDRGEAFLVYKGTAKSDWQKTFEDAASKLIKNELLTSKIVVDAAIADPNVLKRIIPDEYINDFKLIYFHPFDRKFYFQGILNRFIDDARNSRRSFPIWNEITEEIWDDYQRNGEKGMKVISIVNKYGTESADLSVERFEKFKKVFPEIILTGH